MSQPHTCIVRLYCICMCIDNLRFLSLNTKPFLTHAPALLLDFSEGNSGNSIFGRFMFMTRLHGRMLVDHLMHSFAE